MLIKVLLVSASLLSLTPAGSSAAGTIPDSAQLSKHNVDSLIIALRAQNEIIRQDDQKLVNVVYWSLGGLVGLAALLIGFSWFANTRIYERDKAVLRQELQTSLASDFASHSDASRRQLDELSNQLENIVNRHREGITASIKNSIEQSERSLKMSINGLAQRVVQGELKQLNSEATHWYDTKVYMNAVRTHFQVIEKAKELSFDYFRDQEIGESIDGIKRSLKLAGKIPATDAADFLEAIDKIPARFSADAESLKELIKSSRT